MEITGHKTIYMHEADTCPHTLWACPAVREVDHLAMLALDGVKSGKIWIARTGNNHEKRSFEVYRREFREQRGIVEWATRDDFRMTGVVLPIPRRSKGNRCPSPRPSARGGIAPAPAFPPRSQQAATLPRLSACS